MKKKKISIEIKEGFKDQWHITINGKRGTFYGRDKAADFINKCLLNNSDNVWGDVHDCCKSCNSTDNPVEFYRAYEGFQVNDTLCDECLGEVITEHRIAQG